MERARSTSDEKLIALAVAYAIQEPYCIDPTRRVRRLDPPEEMTEAVSVAAAFRGAA